MDRIRIIVVICGMLALCGCSEELVPDYGNRDSEGMPVCFTAEWPLDESECLSRAITDKQNFKDGDAIHVSAVFNLKPGTLGDGEPSSVTKYAVLVLEDGVWVNRTMEEEFDMDWPWNAVSAKFTAYYMEAWNGLVAKPDVPLDAVVLHRFEYGEGKVMNPDPLEAVTGEVEYGHAVHLQFRRLCARLTVSGVADYDALELRFKPTATGERKLLNACTMKRTRDNSLDFTFVAEKSGRMTSQVDKGTDGSTSTTFHLPPGDYSTFTLTRRNGYSYLTVSNVEELTSLEAGNSYSVSLENLKGHITEDDDGDDWLEGVPDEEPEAEEYTDFSMDEFMDAITKCEKDYICTRPDGTKDTLLKKNPYRKEMLLMKNIDLGFDEDYEPMNLPSNVTFDGGDKYILNLARPLFYELDGTVTRLNLWNARLVHDDSSSGGTGSENKHDMDWGVLACISRGDVSNIRLTNAKLDIKLHNKEGDAYHVGALIGDMRSGSTLSNSSLVDSVDVEVYAANESVAYDVCVGGVVGQSSGMMEDIDVLSYGIFQPVLKVINNCKGNGNRYTGGVAGLFAEGRLNDCEVNVEVDASGAEGIWNYAGGVVGAIREDGNLDRCTVAGRVTGGKINNLPDAHSSVGGLAGYVVKSSVTDGTVFCKVIMSADYEIPTENIYYYTVGGVIGSMADVYDPKLEGILKNEGRNYFDTTPYAGKPHYHVGTFAGVGNEAWLKGNGNTANGTGTFIGYAN